jgi:cell division protein FtsZ
MFVTPTPKPVAEEVEDEDMPSLFTGYEAEVEGTSASFEAVEEETEDGLPAPAYRPEAVAPAPAPAPEPEPEPQAMDTYVAPKAPRPGQPSAETLARLQAAIHRAPTRPIEEHHEEKSRFGINSLINRMTGDRHPGQAAQAAPQARQQPAMHTQEAPRAADPAKDHDQEKIEIPAFLRRQAN